MKHIRQALLWIVIVVGFTMYLAAAAQAQMACGTRDSVVATLSEKYGEVRRGGGLAGPTAIFEIWASDVTGTWTILKTTADGLTCVMAVGENWQDDDGDITPIARDGA